MSLICPKLPQRRGHAGNRVQSRTDRAGSQSSTTPDLDCRDNPLLGCITALLLLTHTHAHTHTHTHTHTHKQTYTHTHTLTYTHTHTHTQTHSHTHTHTHKQAIMKGSLWGIIFNPWESWENHRS